MSVGHEEVVESQLQYMLTIASDGGGEVSRRSHFPIADGGPVVGGEYKGDSDHTGRVYLKLGEVPGSVEFGLEKVRQDRCNRLANKLFPGPLINLAPIRFSDHPVPEDEDVAKWTGFKAFYGRDDKHGIYGIVPESPEQLLNFYPEEAVIGLGTACLWGVKTITKR